LAIHRHGVGIDAQENSGAIKKLLWTGLMAGSLATVGLLARRTSAAIWEALLHEPPPTRKA
jgi:hypothetical protein